MLIKIVNRRLKTNFCSHKINLNLSIFNNLINKLSFLLLILSITTISHADNTQHHKKKHSHRKHISRQTANVAAVASKSISSPVVADANPPESAVIMNKIDLEAVANQPRLYSYAALAVDAKSGEILVSKNPNTKLPIASVSKLMMAMTLLDSGANLDDYVTISSADIDTLRNQPSRLKVGMSLRRRDLLLLALMSSENRAAFALARTAYPGGIKVFITKMNEKCASLGMTHSQFYDPTGLTQLNQSTASDLAKMVQAAFGYQEIREDTTTKGADVVLGKNYVHHYINSDALVRAGKLNIVLSKTGFINEAGHCLVLYSIVNKQPIIMVFLNSSGKNGRLVDAIAVKNYVQSLS